MNIHEGKGEIPHQVVKWTYSLLYAQTVFVSLDICIWI